MRSLNIYLIVGLAAGVLVCLSSRIHQFEKVVKVEILASSLGGGKSLLAVITTEAL